MLIVDGQQRLTSLFAVITGVPVVREDYSEGRIEIAFSPPSEKFEVADAAILKDKTFLPSITAVLKTGADIFDVVDRYLEGLRSVRDISDDETRAIRKSIQRLSQLNAFPFMALELSSTISEEQVAEVFVRVNSQGKPLNQADFILTLMSVFWDEGRTALEQFCRQARVVPTGSSPSPHNHLIQPDPDQLLRVSVGLGFKRARLQHVYSILRGKDLQTGEFSLTRRDQQFAVLKDAQLTVLNLQYWHDYFKAVRLAGYCSGAMISSNTALVFSYTLYLIGRTELRVPEHELRRAIARWLFMSLLTGRYTSSPEAAMDFDLANLRGAKTAEDFLRVLDAACAAVLTRDFWAITIPSELATSAARSPSMFAYLTSLVLLDARVLFSEQKVAELLAPGGRGYRASIERHHLFPKAHLAAEGITERRDTNQIANFALVEWGDNARIASKAPSVYVPRLTGRFSSRDVRQMFRWHALPDGWEGMEYKPFLERRRELIAGVIKEGYSLLLDGAPKEAEIDVAQLVAQGETLVQEFKSTLRTNLHTGQVNPRMELGCLKTIAGFMNHSGGRLIIGVADDGTPAGVEEDRFASEDKMHQHLVNLIRDRIGAPFMMYVHAKFDTLSGKRVLVVECSPGRSPVFVKDGGVDRFYVRSGVTTLELPAAQAHEYIGQRFATV